MLNLVLQKCFYVVRTYSYVAKLIVISSSMFLFLSLILNVCSASPSSSAIICDCQHKWFFCYLQFGFLLCRSATMKLYLMKLIWMKSWRKVLEKLQISQMLLWIMSIKLWGSFGDEQDRVVMKDSQGQTSLATTTSKELVISRCLQVFVEYKLTYCLMQFLFSIITIFSVMNFSGIMYCALLISWIPSKNCIVSFICDYGTMTCYSRCRWNEIFCPWTIFPS